MLLNRREFIKSLAVGGTVLAFNPVLFAQRYAQKADLSYTRPVWKDVDVVVIGSATGGIAAALAAAEAGARVMVVTEYPYMGEDICAAFRYWPAERVSASPLFSRVFPGGTAPYPLHVKTVLENELIAHGVEFVYCSFVSNILTDRHGRAAGVCISNRSGQQS